jgi:hypothetical protein
MLNCDKTMKPGITNRELAALVLADWRELNASPRNWASFEAVRFKHETRYAIKWGTIHSNGMKEIPIQTIVYTLYDTGRCDAVRLTHS